MWMRGCFWFHASLFVFWIQDSYGKNQESLESDLLWIPTQNTNRKKENRRWESIEMYKLMSSPALK